MKPTRIGLALRGRPGGGARARKGPRPLWVILPLLLAVLLAVFAAMTLGSNKRTLLIQARTGGATLTFVGNSNSWLVPEAVICTPREAPDWGQQGGGEICDAALFEIQTLQDHTIQWREGDTVELTQSPDGQLAILLRAGTSAPKGTLVFLPAEHWRHTGALTFTAVATVGRRMASGVTGYLVEGHWEAREGGFWTSLLRSNDTEIVKSGELSRYTSASVWTNDAPSPMFGFVMPSDDKDTESSFHIAVLSHPADVELHVEHFGTINPSVIKPDLIDLALSSPLLLALAILLSLLASLSQIVWDLADRISRRPDTLQEAPDTSAP